jgi:hypothetical protein
MAFVAVPARARVGILVAVSVAVCLWRVWPAPEVRAVEPDPGWSLVPLSGEVLANATGCLPFLAPVIAHRGWTLQIDERVSGCLGTDEIRTFVVNEHGGVVVRERGLRDRELQLTAGELGRLRSLDQRSCVPTEDGGYGLHYYELSIGPSDGQGGARVAYLSEIGAALGELLDAAMQRHADHVAATQPMRIVLAARRDDDRRGWTRRSAVYRLEVDAGGLLTVHRGRRELYRRQLESRQLADLIDATHVGAVDWHDDEDDRDYALARGTIMIDRASRELVLGPMESGPILAPLNSALYTAEQEWWGLSGE